MPKIKTAPFQSALGATVSNRLGSRTPFRAFMRGFGSALDISGTANREFLRQFQARNDLDALRGDMGRVGADYRSAINQLAKQSSMQQCRAIEQVRNQAIRQMAEQNKQLIQSLRAVAAEAAIGAVKREQARHAAASLTAGTISRESVR